LLHFGAGCHQIVTKTFEFLRRTPLVEIEVPELIKYSGHNDQPIAAMKIRDSLLAAGLKASYVSTRGYSVIPGEDPNVRIILSVPVPVMADAGTKAATPQ
jgi:hypothetical protein